MCIRILFSLLNIILHNIHHHWISNESLKPREILQIFILYIGIGIHFNRDEIEIVIHFWPIFSCTYVMYGKNRRYFKTLATAVNTCRRENTEYNISYLFMCIHFGVGYRRYYTHPGVLHTCRYIVRYLLKISRVSKPTIYFYCSSITICRHHP